MALTAYLIADAFVSVATIFVGILTVYYVVRQKLERMFSAKVYLASFFVGLTIAVSFDVFRDFFISPSLAIFYKEVTFAFLASAIVSLSMIAYVAYSRPSEQEFSQRVKMVLGRRFFPHGLAITGIVAYAIFVVTYMLIETPFTVQTVTTGGSVAYAVTSTPMFLALLMIGLLAYLLYPLPLLTLSAIRARSNDDRESILLFAIGSTTIGIISFAASSLVIMFGSLGLVLVHTVIMCVVIAYAYSFRKMSLFGEIFEAPKLSNATMFKNINANSIGKVLDPNSFDAPILLEMDSGMDYVSALRRFVLEELTNGKSLVFIFTFYASALFKSLSDIPELRFYISTPQVSSPRPGKAPNMILMPAQDSSIMIDLLEKTLSTPNLEATPIFIFDNLSDWLISKGLEETARNLKTMLELIVSEDPSRALFLIISGSQEEKALNYIRGQFQRLYLGDSYGIRKLK